MNVKLLIIFCIVDELNFNTLVNVAGARTLDIGYHQYDGMTPRAAIMTSDEQGNPDTPRSCLPPMRI